jgi:hypothetical protein
MKTFRILLSVEIIVDAESEEQAQTLAQPLIAKLSYVSEDDLDVNDVSPLVCEPLDDDILVDENGEEV